MHDALPLFFSVTLRPSSRVSFIHFNVLRDPFEIESNDSLNAEKTKTREERYEKGQDDGAGHGEQDVFEVKGN